MEIEAFRLATPTTGQIIILIIIAVVVMGFFIVAARKYGGRTGKKPSGVGWHSFYQIARLRGLNKEETDILRELVETYGLTKPNLIFTSRTILDGCIQRAIRRASLRETGGDSKEDLISTFYRIRNKIARTRKTRGITTTTAIPIGTRLRVEVPGYGNYTVNVNRNESEYLGISIPFLPPGRSVPWNRKKVKCSFWKENQGMYSFETKVMDVLVTDEIQCICLKHTDNIKRVQKRRYPRKSVRLPVFFSRVRVFSEAGKKKAVVDRRDTHWGTIIDLSVGGLSIESTIPVNRDNYIRVEFELREEYRVVGYGKVKRIEKNTTRKTWVMHIQFTKIDKKHRNEIFAVLYNYQTI